MTYRSFKNIDINTFNRDLSNCLNDLSFLTVDDAFEQLIAHISNCLDKHAPLKQKNVRGNQSRFMNKELAKAIMVRSRLKSKYQKRRQKLKIKLSKNSVICVKNLKI